MPDRSTPGGGYARTVLVLGVFTSGTFVLFAILARVPVPWWDDWDWLAWLLSAPPSAGRLFLPHNEHVIPIARLLYVLQYRLQGANGSLLAWIALTCQLAVGAIFRSEIARAWPHDPTVRRAALGGSLLTLFSAWQLHSVVAGASVLFPLVLVFAVAAISMGLNSMDRTGRARGVRTAGTLLASLGAMFSMTSGVAVPVVVAALAGMRRSSWTLAVANVLLAISGAVIYTRLVPSGHAAESTGVASFLSGLPVVVGFFCALFAPVVTYLNAASGVVAGGIMISAGLILSVGIVRTWQQAPRIERFAVGVMAFTLASALMAAFGRARIFGLEYAAQSRYATFSMACWAALLLMTLSVAGRGATPRLVRAFAPSARVLAVPTAVLLVVIHCVSGVVWIAKADNLRAAGLALAADSHDDEWIGTLHSSVDAVYEARSLARADGDRTLDGADLGRQVTAPDAVCQASLSLAPAPQGPALRLTGSVQVESRAGWILDSSGTVVGLAARSPLVDRPDPSGAMVVAAMRNALIAGTLFSNNRWIGFAPASARPPLTFVAVQSDRGLCRAAITRHLTEIARKSGAGGGGRTHTPVKGTGF